MLYPEERELVLSLREISQMCKAADRKLISLRNTYPESKAIYRSVSKQLRRADEIIQDTEEGFYSKVEDIYL